MPQKTYKKETKTKPNIISTYEYRQYLRRVPIQLYEAVYISSREGGAEVGDQQEKQKKRNRNAANVTCLQTKLHPVLQPAPSNDDIQQSYGVWSSLGNNRDSNCVVGMQLFRRIELGFGLSAWMSFIARECWCRDMNGQEKLSMQTKTKTNHNINSPNAYMHTRREKQQETKYTWQLSFK